MRSMPVRHFVKYTFLKVDPAWRRLDSDEPAAVPDGEDEQNAVVVPLHRKER